MKKLVSWIFYLFFICNPGYAREIIDLYPEHPGALFCWSEYLSEPRPLKIHFLMVDLTAEELEVITLSGDDPDGDGPAESKLTPPVDLFNRHNAVAAVNANAFAKLVNEKVFNMFWYENQPVDILGMAISQGKILSPAEPRRKTFWIDKNRKPHIGDPGEVSSVMEAVADWFLPLIVDSKIIPGESDEVLHPRTAAGFDDSGKWLLMVVIDGRQPEYSEGVTLYELAEIMKKRGCTQAINFDGGGSSIMLIRGPDNKVITFNRPSDGVHRPVPVMLGVRERS